MKSKFVFFTLLILILWIIFVTSEIVTINLWPFGVSIKAPIIVLILFSLIIGFIIGYISKSIKK